MPTAVKAKHATRNTTRKVVPKGHSSYDEYKTYNGKQYTGMRVGGSHKWNYDAGDWIETKITPDLWRISYAVTKRRAGKAPKGSGVPVGTGYHWYILAHQEVTKLNANDYTTELTGMKYKLAHKRAVKNTWSTKTITQRKHLIAFLKEFLHELEKDVVPLEFEYNGKIFKGEAVPLPGTCNEGVCFQLEVMLNDEFIGIIRSLKNGWKMSREDDQKFVDAIGEEIMGWYE